MQLKCVRLQPPAGFSIRRGVTTPQRAVALSPRRAAWRQHCAALRQPASPPAHLPTCHTSSPSTPLKPQVSFYPPDFVTSHGGLNINHKVAVIDATRLGPKKTYDINIPPVNIPNLHPVTVEYKQPPRVIVDLTQFGPKDATVVQLPKIAVNISHPVKVIHDEAQVRVSRAVKRGQTRSKRSERGQTQANAGGSNAFRQTRAVPPARR